MLILSNKPDIVSEDDILQPGQKLRVPLTNEPISDSGGRSTETDRPAASSTPSASSTTRVNGAVIHTVLRAETLIEIAAKYGVEVDDIVKANSMKDPDALSVGDELRIPNPKSRPTQPVPEDDKTTTSSGSGSGSGSGAGTGSGSTTPSTVPIGPKSNSGFIWPVGGPISSYFGPAHPLGIDIDLFGSPNAPIGAVAAGTVTFAGGNTCCSYGLYVIIDHGNGLQTLYAHLSSISVSVGQKVNQGTVLGNGGRTGYATGNHLHFEVHKNGVVVNPTAYLP